MAMPKPEQAGGEDLAAYKLLLYETHFACPGPGCCSDPLAFKKLLCPRKKKGTVNWCFSSAWCRRKAEIRNLAKEGVRKMDSAGKVAVIHDTSLCKTWWPDESMRPCFAAKAVLVQCMTQKWGIFVGGVLQRICSFADVPSGIHEDQLHMEELDALVLSDVLDNAFLQKLASTKPLQVEKLGAVDADSEDVEDCAAHVGGLQAEFLGGEPQQYEEACDTEDEDVQGALERRPEVLFTPAESEAILARAAALKRASQPGKRRESDVHAQHFMSVFGPHIPNARDAVFRETLADLMPFQDSARMTSRQTAVVQEFRLAETDPERLKKLHAPSTADLPQWQALMMRNTSEFFDCHLVDLPDVMKGPAYVAWELVKANRMTEEQIDVTALVTLPMQKAFENRPDKSTYKLPTIGNLVRLAILGGGGCGKSTLLMKIFTPLFQAFFDKIVRGAPSNKAARAISGRTIHALAGLLGSDSLRTFALRIKSDAERKKLQATFARAGALMLDEFSQLPAGLLHALVLRAAYARSSVHRLDVNAYCEQSQLFGAVPICIMLGDHLQLPPVPKTTSLLSGSLQGAPEHRAGCAVFANLEFIYQMHTAMRFTDPVLISILSKMRVPGGQKLTCEEKNALRQTQIDEAPAGSRVRPVPVMRAGAAWLPEYSAWHQACYLWSVTTLVVYMRSLQSAATAGRILFCSQALDSPSKPANKELYAEMLEEPSLSVTKRLSGFCLFHLHMRVRFTCNVLPPFVCQDTAGEIVGIKLHAAEGIRRSREPNVEGLVHHLEYLPEEVYVKVDDCNIEFLPPQACDEHVLVGASSQCSECRFWPGVVQVKPVSAKWYFSSKTENFSASVRRMQLPIIYEKACALYSLQGVTADGLIAHLQMPSKATLDIQYLIVYVMLSRVRSLQTLRTVGLTEKIFQIIESGPPKELTDAFDSLFADKARETKSKAQEARAGLGWPLSA